MMVGRAADQCHNNLTAGKEVENVANMIVATQKKLAAENVSVTHYELLDVLHSLLGANDKNWDCASALALYISSRVPGNAPPMSHINTYKMLQAFRDNGLLGPKS